MSSSRFWPATAVRLTSALALGITLAGQAAANGPTQVAQRDYGNVKINQLGRASIESREFAQAAALNALDALTKAGLPETALIEVDVDGIEGLMGGGRPQNYDVWVKVADCPSRVHFKAQASGTIYEMNDKANCVAKAKAAGAPAN